jgi:hypothetical protein
VTQSLNNRPGATACGNAFQSARAVAYSIHDCGVKGIQKIVVKRRRNLYFVSVEKWKKQTMLKRS